MEHDNPPGAKNVISWVGAKKDTSADNVSELGERVVVVCLVALVPVVAPSGRGDAVASPRPSVARPRRGPTSASARRPGTVRINIS